MASHEAAGERYSEVMVLAATHTDSQLDALVAAIVERVQPELILLFGSRARGDAREDSDYDIMLVVREGTDAESGRKIAYETRFALKITADILACTASEYQRRPHDPGFLQWLVSREGKVLNTSGTIPQRSSQADRVREQQPEGVQLWISRADDVYRAGLSSLQSQDPPWAAICFHAHACVEKLLKALIVAQGTFPPRTHELAEVMQRAPVPVRDDPEMAAACQLLQGLYLPSRYEPHPMPTPDEARAAFAAARRARELLLRQLAGWRR
jgi:HEPN domain-containing protein/predicted nucleotidyltransferase